MDDTLLHHAPLWKLTTIFNARDPRKLYRLARQRDLDVTQAMAFEALKADVGRQVQAPRPRALGKSAAEGLKKAMTSSMAFRCAQAWLLEKPAAWVGEDAPNLADALMVQRPPGDALRKRPREDALLEAERSRQRSRIELLEEEALIDTRNSVRQERHIRLLLLELAAVRFLDDGAIGGADPGLTAGTVDVYGTARSNSQSSVASASFTAGGFELRLRHAFWNIVRT